MKKITLLVLITIMMFAVNTYAAMTVAQARALGDDAGVDVGPVYISETNNLTSGSWHGFFVQDESGGMQLAGYGPVINELISANNLVPGSCVTFHGTNATYNGIYQIVNIDILVNYGVSNVPAATPIDIDTLATPAPAFKSLEGKLVAITGVDFLDSGTFAGYENYTIRKNGTNGTVRIQNNTDQFVGTAIPFGSDITITGIFGIFNTTYQIFPLIIDGPTRDPYLWIEPYPELNFGVVYPNYTRTLQINIRNGGESNNLDVSGFSSISGDTAKFSPSSIADFTLTPKQETNFSFTYTPGSIADITNSVMYQFNTTDPSNAVINFPMYGKSSATPPPTPAVWINEVAYNDPGVDDEEFIELCGVAGTVITGWKVQLVNGFDGSNYSEWVIGSEIGSFTFADEQDGYGFYVLAGSSSIDIPNTDETMMTTIENGDDDAIRITKADGTEIHFFAYNSKSAIDYEYGLPNDLTPIEDSTLASNSLCKIGTGTEEPDFEWKVETQTPGTLNDEQVLPEPIGLGILLLGLAALLKIRK